MNLSIIKDKIKQNGLTYPKFVNQIEQKINNTITDSLNDEEKHLFEYTKLNYQRMTRINKTYKINNTLCSLLTKISIPQVWMVITEDWCGDSAQNFPYIYKFSECNPLITFTVLQRDNNLEVMDLFLTNGTRSIPKLVVFDQNDNILFQWGARPKEAQDLVTNWKNEGIPKEEFLEKLHLWYGRNRGKAIEQEFINLLTNQIL
ncbi:MAG: thioredoxin family protein [bacterium]